MTQGLLSFIRGLMAGYGIAIPVGAVAVLIISASIQHGFKVGFMSGAGAASADVLYAIVATVAGAALASALETIASELRTVSALVLIGMAIFGLWQGLKRPSNDGQTAETRGPIHAYVQFLGITIINPLTIIYFTALILGRDQTIAPTLANNAAFVIGAGLASFSWQTLLVGLGTIAHKHLPARFQLFAIICGNLLVMALGLHILLKVLL